VVILMDALRPVLELRPDVSLVDALRQFRRGRAHLVIVREREGPVLGICTLEDEHDEPTPAGVQ
jgi:CBS domain containing-hemolysin-like protein